MWCLNDRRADYSTQQHGKACLGRRRERGPQVRFIWQRGREADWQTDRWMTVCICIVVLNLVSWGRDDLLKDIPEPTRTNPTRRVGRTLLLVLNQIGTSFGTGNFSGELSQFWWGGARRKWGQEAHMWGLLFPRTQSTDNSKKAVLPLENFTIGSFWSFTVNKNNTERPGWRHVHLGRQRGREGGPQVSFSSRMFRILSV